LAVVYNKAWAVPAVAKFPLAVVYNKAWAVPAAWTV
jgi:hypothetical protein